MMNFKKMYAKVKCFFGFCEEIEKIELEERKINEMFEPKPKIRKVEVDTPDTMAIDVSEDSNPKKPKHKVKRHWYNNGKEQKLIPVDEKIKKGWIRGKLPKVSKAK